MLFFLCFCSSDEKLNCLSFNFVGNLEAATRVLGGAPSIQLIEQMFVFLFAVFKHQTGHRNASQGILIRRCDSGHSTSCHGPPVSYVPNTTSSHYLSKVNTPGCYHDNMNQTYTV